MLQPFDHGLFLVLAAGLPALAAMVWFPRLMRAPLELLPRRRVESYTRTMVVQWTLVAALVAYWYLRGRGWEALGLRFGTGHMLLAVPAVVVLMVAAGLAVQWRTVRRSAAVRDRLREQLVPVARLLPQRPEERRLFDALSATAGICEELLYRGFMIFYLGHFMPPWLAVLAAGALFGLGHAYQGAGGVLKTGALGVLFGAMYLLTGTLWHLIVLHAMIDMFSGRVGYHVLVEDAPPPELPDGEAALAPAAPLPSSTPT